MNPRTIQSQRQPEFIVVVAIAGKPAKITDFNTPNGIPNPLLAGIGGQPRRCVDKAV